MRRKKSPLHDKWHPIVEGQIRHTIGKHPEWFNFTNDDQKKTCINSLAKRIVGEIVVNITSLGDYDSKLCPLEKKRHEELLCREI